MPAFGAKSERFGFERIRSRWQRRQLAFQRAHIRQKRRVCSESESGLAFRPTQSKQSIRDIWALVRPVEMSNQPSFVVVARLLARSPVATRPPIGSERRLWPQPNKWSALSLSQLNGETLSIYSASQKPLERKASRAAFFESIHLPF